MDMPPKRYLKLGVLESVATFSASTLWQAVWKEARIKTRQMSF